MQARRALREHRERQVRERIVWVRRTRERITERLRPRGVSGSLAAHRLTPFRASSVYLDFGVAVVLLRAK
jgi:hypothetical protein